MIKKIILLGCHLLTILSITAGCKGAMKNKDINAVDSNLVELQIDKNVSLIALIANPEKYNGRLVRVKGFLNIEFEGNAIYLHKEDYELGIDKNGLWIDLDGAKVEANRYKTCNKQYIILEGTFEMENKGHMGGYSGTLNKITRIDKLDH